MGVGPMKSDTRRKPDAPIDLPHIAGYRIEGMLGRGTSGVVYSGVQEVIDRAVALKVLRADLAQSVRAVERFRREARTAARLAHPAIIAPIDMGQLPDGRWWYAMELVEGISLAERIEERGPLKERDALRMFLPLADALQHLHDVGVVHRDVKPANIMIDPRERALLADLGLAFARDEPSLTGSGGVLGTPHYVSPEQARDSSKVDVRSDIWSLGATLYHAVTGRPPFGGSSVAEVFSAVLQEPLVDPRRFTPDLSASFVLVLRACLTRDLEHRYQEPKDLKADLERLLELRAPKVKKEGLEPLAQARRAWLWRVGGAIAAVCFLGLLLWAPWSGESQAERDRRVARGNPLIPLEALESNYTAGRLSPLTMYDRLGAWSAPEAGAQSNQVQQKVQALGIRVLGDIAVALRGLVAEFDPAVHAALDKDDWVEAHRLLHQELPVRLLDKLGQPRLEDLPQEQEVSGFRQWHSDLVVKLEGELLRSLDRVEQLGVAWVDQVVELGVSKSLEAGDLVGALAQAENRVEPVLLHLAKEVQGLPGREVRERIMASVLPRLAPHRDRVSKRWLEVQEVLSAYLKTREPELMEEIESSHVEGMDLELQAGFERLLQDARVPIERVPVAWRQKLQEDLAQASLRLRRRGQDQRPSLARREFEVDQEVARGLLQVRKFEEAADLWSDQLQAPWRVSVFPQMQRELREARLLAGLVERCLGQMEFLEGQEYVLTLGGVGQRVRWTLGEDPLAEAIRVVKVGGSGVQGLWIQRPTEAQASRMLLMPDDLLRLAKDELGRLGGNGAGAERDQEENELAKALFLFHEGRWAESSALLPGLEQTDPLTVSLLQRIHRAENRGEGQSSEELVLDIAALLRDLDSGGQALARWRGELQTLLLEPMLTAEQRDTLQGRLTGLAKKAPPRTVKQLYPDAEIFSHGPELANRRDVRLRWRFDRNPDSWSLGPFQASPGILRTRPPKDLPQPLEPQEGMPWLRDPLSLPLGLPMELSRPMRFAVVFRIPEGSQPGPIMVNVGGFRLAFLTDGKNSRFAGSCGTPESLWKSLAQDSVSGFEGFEGFAPGKRYRLEVELSTLASSRSRRLQHLSLTGQDLEAPALVSRPATTPVFSLNSEGDLDLYVVELWGSAILPQ